MEQVDVTRLLKQNKDAVVIIAILLVCLLAAKKIHDAQVGKSRSMQDQIQIEKDKGESLDRILLLHEEVKKLKNRSWKTTDFNVVVDGISALAADAGVKVSNITPQDKRDETHMIVVPFQMNVECDYKNLLLFLKNLETLPVLTHIRDISMSPIRREAAAAQDPGRPKPAYSMLIVSLTAEAFYIK